MSTEPACVGLLRGLLGASERGEESTQAWVAEQFAALGCEVDRFAYTSLGPGVGCGPAGPGASEQRQCVVGRLPGAPDRRSLLLFAHADCEPVAALERWRYPPFAGEISAGRLHGWGVADDLAGVAAILAAAGAVLAEGRRPAGSLLLVSAPSKRRARGIVEVLRRGYRADGGVYVHPAESERGLAEIKAVTPGLLRFRAARVGPSTGHARARADTLRPSGRQPARRSRTPGGGPADGRRAARRPRPASGS